MTTQQLTPVQSQFRSAMSKLPSAVNVVTTRGTYGEVGLTMTAVCSVTDDPPTFLVCINRKSALRDIFVGNGRLCVNVLSSGHQEIARDFAGMTDTTMQERFAAYDWDLSSTAGHQPRLLDAAATLEGQITSIVEQGTHTIMMVEADLVTTREESGGLAYFQRTFHPITL